MGPDPLAQLNDIHLPPPVGFWPPAPGWWLLGALVLLALITAAVLLWRRWQRNRYRRLARERAQAIYRDYQQHQDPVTYLQAINQLLRQTALAAYPWYDVARLSGREWVQFLNHHHPQHPFGDNETALLADGPYRPDFGDSAAALAQLQQQIEAWLRGHRC